MPEQAGAVNQAVLPRGIHPVEIPVQHFEFAKIVDSPPLTVRQHLYLLCLTLGFYICNTVLCKLTFNPILPRKLPEPLIVVAS